jgi:hypothetical protein
LVSSALTGSQICPRSLRLSGDNTDKQPVFRALFAARLLGNGRLNVDENAKNDFQTGFRICPTFGEILLLVNFNASRSVPNTQEEPCPT